MTAQLTFATKGLASHSKLATLGRPAWVPGSHASTPKQPLLGTESSKAQQILHLQQQRRSVTPQLPPRPNTAPAPVLHASGAVSTHTSVRDEASRHSDVHDGARPDGVNSSSSGSSGSASVPHTPPRTPAFETVGSPVDFVGDGDDGGGDGLGE